MNSYTLDRYLVSFDDDAYFDEFGVCERMRKLASGEDTAEEYIRQCRDFEKYMKAVIHYMSHDEWLEEHDGQIEQEHQEILLRGKAHANNGREWYQRVRLSRSNGT